MIVDSESSKFNMLCKSGMVEVPENCESLREMPLELALSAHDFPLLYLTSLSPGHLPQAPECQWSGRA